MEAIEANQNSSEVCIAELFAKAKTNGGSQYLFTLLRVDGICFETDPLIQLDSYLVSLSSGVTDREMLQAYCRLVSCRQALELVTNLLNCRLRRPYNGSPFIHLNTGTFPNVTPAKPWQCANEVAKLASEAEVDTLSTLILSAYVQDVISGCTPASENPSETSLREAYCNCLTFLKALLHTYFAERLSFKQQPRLYKLPGFEVLELLVNEELGLVGFNMHFSNGNRATFLRNKESTECINMSLGPPVELYVGSLDDLKGEWRIGNKRLYEVGLPGRYNKLGEWKPIVYPANSDQLDQLQNEVMALSQDGDVQGSIFYMMCTGHRVIEFVVRSNVNLPDRFGNLGGRYHFWKCPTLEGCDPGIKIYDAWVDLDKTDEAAIKHAIAMIGIVVNRLVFPFNGKADWTLKYKMVSSHGNPAATPSEEDLKLLDSLLAKFPIQEEAIILDAGIDWYNNGRSSKNPFTAFFCYYVAFESVAVAIAEGDADFGLGYTSLARSERKERKKDCIKETHERLYETDPIKFVEESYFRCVLSLKNKCKSVAERVFGVEHEYVSKLFQKGEDGSSLSDIRGLITHGEVAVLYKEHENLVRMRLHEIMTISNEFLLRLSFQLKPSESLPSWSKAHSVSMGFGDPRNTLVANNEKILSTLDWKIRLEWLD